MVMEKKCCPVDQRSITGAELQTIQPSVRDEQPCACTAGRADAGEAGAGLKQSFVVGAMHTPVGDVPQVSPVLSRADRWGSIKARWGVGRMHYSIEPGLYALGRPDSHSPVLVSANYKMSFDRLRQALPGRDLWILALDTKGINVWCAAGKGTFGTGELVERISASRLHLVVSHRKLIVPQLAGPGVAAHKVHKLSGFNVIYGPIRAEDLPRFMDAGFKAEPEMRRKTFTIGERAVLIPVELVSCLKWALIIAPAVFLLGGLGGRGGFWENAMQRGLFAVSALMTGVTAGTVLTPLLLPWLPGRAFSVKGLCVGLIAATALMVFHEPDLGGWPGRLEFAAWFMLVPAVAAYLGMNFTGCSTYTSLSGVKKEMRWAVPLEIGACVVGLGLWVGSRFLS